MEPELIKKIMKGLKITQQDIADSLNPPVKQSSVSQVICKKQTSRRIQNQICRKINRSFNEVWSI